MFESAILRRSRWAIEHMVQTLSDAPTAVGPPFTYRQTRLLSLMRCFGLVIL